jgi:hypothetical protein
MQGKDLRDSKAMHLFLLVAIISFLSLSFDALACNHDIKK